MKRILLSLLIPAVAQVAVLAQSTWKADPPHSRIGFVITHLGISEITGAFNTFDVSIVSAKPDFSDAAFQLKVGPKFPPPMIADEFVVKADGEFIKQLPRIE